MYGFGILGMLVMIVSFIINIQKLKGSGGGVVDGMVVLKLLLILDKMFKLKFWIKKRSNILRFDIYVFFIIVIQYEMRQFYVFILFYIQ